MDLKRVEEIYNRLQTVSIQIERKSIPNPKYISEKICECHMCIEEVEKFLFEANREYSTYQMALNNAETVFSIARDELITLDEEESTGSKFFKDKEVRANNKLKDQINDIKNYKNELSILSNLIDAIKVKLKNLGRANGDIRIQMRLMEAQMRLGDPEVNDASTKKLMEELKNTILEKDILEEATSTVSESGIIDTNNPINPDILFSQTDDPFNKLEKSIQETINDVPKLDSETTPVNNLPLLENNTLNEIIDSSENIDEESATDFYEGDDLFEEEPKNLNDEKIIIDENLDLNSILDPCYIPQSNPKTGGVQEIIKEDTIIKVDSDPERVQKKEQNRDEISFEDLLGQFNS